MIPRFSRLAAAEIAGEARSVCLDCVKCVCADNAVKLFFILCHVWIGRCKATLESAN